MGNTSEKNITTHRWFIQKEDEVNSKTFLIPFSLNSMFELQTSLFKTPNATEITITSTNDRVYLNDKKIYINYTQEKEDIKHAFNQKKNQCILLLELINTVDSLVMKSLKELGESNDKKE